MKPIRSPGGPLRIYSRPVIPLLASMIAGIALGSRLPGHTVWICPIMVGCAGFIIYCLKQKKTACLSPIILFVALGYIAVQPWVAFSFPSDPIIHFENKTKWKITGLVDSNPVKTANRQKFILRAETLKEKQTSFSVCGKIRVTVIGNGPKLSMGDRIFFSSKIRPIRNFNNPGGFDYKRYMDFKRIWGTAYVQGKNLLVLEKRSEKSIRISIQDARDKISGLIERTKEGDHQGVLKALIIGDKSSIPHYLREAFNRAGVGHLLAISGLHIGIVATVFFLSFAWILSCFNTLLWHARTKKGAAVLSLLPVFFYGLIAGMSPSTQRAVIMVTVFLMTFLIEREHDSINTLAIAAMLILMVHPPSLFSISFQLSFSAVFSILYGLSLIQGKKIHPESKKKRWWSHILEKLISFIWVSLFAILGTMPLVMLYFNQVSLVGLLTNLIVVPVIGFGVVPLGLFAVFLYPVSAGAATMVFNASGVVLTQALDIVCFIADLPFAAIKTVTPSIFEIGCYYVLAWAGLHIISGKPFVRKAQEVLSEPETDSSGPIKRTVLRRKTAFQVAGIILLAVCVDACYWLHNRFRHDDLRVTVIDVGQGSSALLEIPGGHRVLIDGGGSYDNSVFDMGATVVAPFLWRKKIKTVDTLILSHPNADHLNGLIYIAEHFNVKRLWTNNEAVKTVGYQKLMEIVEKNKIQMPPFESMRCTNDINGVQLNILYPKSDFLEKRKKKSQRNLNNNSLVLQAAFGSKAFLFPGDILAEAEKELVATQGDALKSTVLIAPHHGSRTSSTKPFLEKVKPEFAVISCGFNNRFGFPHPSVLKRYTKQGCRVFRTDRNGAVTLSTDGRSFRIRPFIN